MRLIFLFMFILGMSATSYAQMDQDKMFYFSKIEKYRRMKTTGKTLTFLGSAMVVGAVLIVVNAEEKTTYTNNGYATSVSDDAIIGASLAYLGGMGALGAGIPLWIVGGVNEGKYTRLSQQNTVRLEIDPGRAGLKLSCRF